MNSETHFLISCLQFGLTFSFGKNITFTFLLNFLFTLFLQLLVRNNKKFIWAINSFAMDKQKASNSRIKYNDFDFIPNYSEIIDRGTQTITGNNKEL